jgi:hypothetical protein
MYGLLAPGSQNLLPYLLRMISALRLRLRNASAEQFWKSCDEFRETFAQKTPQRSDRRFPIERD